MLLDLAPCRGKVGGIMIQVCAWCEEKIREVEDSQPGVSHGICANCTDNFRFQEGVALSEYIDSLPEPVYVVDDNLVVQGVNRIGCTVLDKHSHDIIKELGGDVFECAYARLPERCGRTIHCSGCTIRKAVKETFQTGEPRIKVPAILNQDDEDEPSVAYLTITTVKSDEVVFLRIDKMSPGDTLH